MGFHAVVLLAASAIGCSFGHHERVYPTSVSECDSCGIAPSRVYALIETLQTHPRWRTRDAAAHELRDFDWRCHPEILAALSTAMLTDCENEVREEAAESLTKIQPAPCSPEVHAALARTAECDRDWCTRKWARKGMARLDDRCQAACNVCELTPTGYMPPPRPLFGRFLLPRNNAFLAPGARVDMPISEPTIVSPPEIIETVPPNLGEYTPPPPVEPSLITPTNPLDDLRSIEALPDASLPRAVNPEPRIPPPPAAADGSPFDLRPRAERPTSGRFAMNEPAEKPRAEDRDSDSDERKQPQRRRSILSGLFGRR